MEYSELVRALQNGDDVRANKILRDLIPRLQRFLEVHMGADKRDAEDCVQYSLELTLDILREGKLKDSDKLLTYLMTTCRNNYLKNIDKNREVNYEEVPSHRFNEPAQFRALLDKERKRILKRCLEELKDLYRNFIEFWFDHPDSSAETVADHFNISVNNAWTRKHRVIKQLNECYKKKSEL